MNICTESSRSQRQNKPVGASLFCPLLMKPVGWVKRGWLPSISSGPHFRAWQVAEELAVAVGSLSSSAALGHEAVGYRGGATAFYLQDSSSLCRVWRGWQCPSRCHSSQLLASDVSQCLSTLMKLHLHPWNCIKAQRKQLRWEEPGDMEPATWKRQQVGRCGMETGSWYRCKLSKEWAVGRYIEELWINRKCM